MKRRLALLGAALAGGVALWRVLRRPAPVSLRDKVVIITGASSGIGKATAHAFAKEGARVVLAARRAEKLLDTAAELDAYGGPSALVIPTDVIVEEDRQALISAVVREFGCVDVLVNNAGIDALGRFHTQDPDAIQQMLQVNLYAPMRLTQLVLPVMLDQGEGHIVNVSSISARMPVQGVVGYVAAKGGGLAFYDALRRELYGHGVYVSSVLPAFTYSEMLNDHQASVLREMGYYISSPEVPAAAIVDAVRYRRREVLLGGPVEKAFVWMHTLAPGLLDHVMGLGMPPEKLDEFLEKMMD